MSLWKRFQSFWLVWMVSPRMRSHKDLISVLEASFCTCEKASLTVEAAVVIPLTAGFLASILFLFQVLAVQSAVDEALMYAGRKVAVESSFVASDEALFVSAEAFLLIALEEEEIVEQYVENGILGIHLFSSKFYEKEIILQANYNMVLPIGFFGTIEIPLYSRNTFQKWTGDSYVNEDEEWVYITKYGTVYHGTRECQALDITVYESKRSQVGSLRGANGQKFYACGSCEKKIENERVYYTDYGTLYHGDISCSVLKRIIIKVPLSEVVDRNACSFCY